VLGNRIEPRCPRSDIKAGGCRRCAAVVMVGPDGSFLAREEILSWLLPSDSPTLGRIFFFKGLHKDKPARALRDHATGRPNECCSNSRTFWFGSSGGNSSSRAFPDKKPNQWSLGYFHLPVVRTPGLGTAGDRPTGLTPATQRRKPQTRLEVVPRF
jgi:hypothetical protein